ncbi:MAG: tRNA preQ1(34) S-adenosylmethionine ribosyltransferase-isomerase QueA [Victivallales bacterium]|nr:tRNA preQ1(34) S-adenosylmethionine ribosyltransferase-isomerase QueA [Victivallales bacterium]
MKVSDFDFDLPEELIAQFPSQRREECRMLVLDRKEGEAEIHPFTDFGNYMQPGDCLVINDTRVLRARLWGHRPGSGGRVQAFVLKQLDKASWQCLLKPGRRMQPGTQVMIDGAEASFTVLSHNEDGTFNVMFDTDDVLDLLERAGQVPLPPYITRQPTKEDAERYQTVYAREPGAVAAPTAGLHFSKEMLEALKARGIRIASLTLHVGAGTFKPVSVDNVEEHIMHEERFFLTEEAASMINTAHDEGHRVVCVGTTTVRVLESCVIPGTRKVAPRSGSTSIFLYPPYKAIVPDALLTNFHLPQSTLIMLVCTFADRDRVFAAYKKAIDNKMHFYSYGDCMLLK